MCQSAAGFLRGGVYGLVVLFLCAASAFAQFRAGIQGTVKDTSGAVVAGVTVTVTNQETGKSQQVSTSAEGFYRVAGLPPGAYTVKATFAGFKEQVIKNLAVSAEQVQGADITIQPGDVKEAVTVTAEAAPVLHTENADSSRTLSTLEIQRLPQVGRDPYELLRLTPGVFGDGARSGNGNSVGLPNTTGPGGSNSSIYQTENQVPISANGQRLSDNNYQIDGVSVNSLGFGGTAVITPNQESVKELRVVSAGYSAEYGRNSGAQVEVVTKNGTNQLHGSGFIKFDDKGLNAFNRFGGVNLPPVRVNNKLRQFGMSVGGALVKDKLFGFFSYEGLRKSSSDTANAFVETPQYRQLVIANRPGSVTAKIFGSPGIEPRIVSVATVPCSGFAPGNCQQVPGGLDIGSLIGSTNQFVDPGLNPKGGGLDGIPDIQFVQLALPATQKGNQYNGRVDYNRGKDSFAASLFFTRLDDFGPDAGGRSRPMGDVGKMPLNQTGTLLWTRVLLPNLLNEARLNYTRFSFDQVQSAASTNFGIPRLEVESLPFDRIRFGADRSEGTPGIFAQNTYEFRDTVSHTVRNMAFKYGVEIRKEQDNNSLIGGARPLYSFQGLWNLANGTPIFEAINTDPRTGLPADSQRHFRTITYGLFAQDDWKLRPNLTLNLGLRWEYFTPLREKQGLLSNLVFGPNGLKDSKVVVFGKKDLFEGDKNNVAPRFGFAYSPRRFNQKLVARGGFGMFYNRIPEALFGNTRGNPPFFARNNICCGTATTSFGTPFANGQILYALGSSNSPTSFPVNPALAFGIDPKTGGVCGNAACTFDTAVELWGTTRELRNAYVYVYSYGLEYSLPWNLVATASYEGSAGHKQIRLVNQNFLFPNNPAFFQIFFPRPDVNTSYNSLNLGLKRRFARGLLGQANYRYSKSIDTLSFEGPGAVTNQTFPQDLKSERGPSDFDTTHYFVGSALYDLPFFRNSQNYMTRILGGWQVNGIVTFHSGFPWTVKTGRSVSTPGGPSLGPTRPVAVIGTPLNDHSNDAFLRPGGNFPGGGAKFFDFTTSGPPGIGRNTFRGPRFFNIDLSFAKDTPLPATHYLGEAAKLKFRANFFNAFNKRNLAPFGFFSQGTFADNALFFGRADSGLAGRVIEFEAGVSF